MHTSPVDFALAFSTGLVAFTFLLSGGSKIGRTPATLRSMVEVRTPSWLQHTAIARLVPAGELVLGLALIFLPGLGRTLAGTAAVVVLVVFTVLLVGVVRRRDDVDCGCFGALTVGQRVTWGTVARNGVLVATALVVALLSTDAVSLVESLIQGSAVFTLGVLLSWAIVFIGVLAVALFAARRRTASTGEIANEKNAAPAPPLSPQSLALGLDPRRPGELSMGAAIPHAELVASNGVTQALSSLGNGNPTLLVFLSADCSSCVPVAKAVPGWQQELGRIAVRVATSSPPESIASLEPELAALARYGSQAAIRALGVQRSPAAVMLGGHENPIIASPIAYGLHEVESLVQSVLQARS